MRLVIGFLAAALGVWAEPALTKLELMGRLDPARDRAFVAVGDTWLRQPAADALARMQAAAARDGITLRVISATRTFADQKRIWERKWKALAEPDEAQRALQIMRYSSMPGTSRHHWGTDVDLNSLSPRWFTDTAEGRKVYDWLTRHAAEHGFCQPYTAKGEGRATGYAEEKWHWSYQPLASAFLKQYLAEVRATDITGFAGAGAARAVRSIEDYVNGVDPACR